VHTAGVAVRAEDLPQALMRPFAEQMTVLLADPVAG